MNETLDKQKWRTGGGTVCVTQQSKMASMKPQEDDDDDVVPLLFKEKTNIRDVKWLSALSQVINK